MGLTAHPPVLQCATLPLLGVFLNADNQDMNQTFVQPYGIFFTHYS